jgi:hypothetical protein
VYSLLLLSGNPKIAGLGVQIAFAGLRFALAATQTGTTGTNDFYRCLDTVNTPNANPYPQLTNGYYKGELWNALSNGAVPPNSETAGVPVYSGQILTNPPAYTPLPLGPDGARVICASIAMMSGDPTDPKYVTNGGWQNQLMWQGAADITNALYGTIQAYPKKISEPDKKGLCLATRAIYTFSTVSPPTDIKNEVVTVAFPPAISEVEFDRQCWTTPLTCTQVPTNEGVDWIVDGGFNTRVPKLAAGHDLGTSPITGVKSPFIAVCTLVLP